MTRRGLTKSGLALCLSLAAWLCACEKASKPYVLVFLDTDAPLPCKTSASEPIAERTPCGAGREAHALFDTLWVAVARSASTLNASQYREFSLTAEMFQGGPISFAVQSETQRYAKFVLGRRRHLASSFDIDEIGVSATVRLPKPQPDGVKTLVTLRVDDIGEDELGEPRNARMIEEPPKESRVGSWPPSTPVDCSEPSREGEVCLPGGAFWMGDPELRGNPQLPDSDRERLVILSPFYLDRTEVTVGQFRELWPTLEALGLPAPPTWSGKSTGADKDDWATWTPERIAERDPLPVSGVPWRTASEFCRLQGKALPSEAMFEYAASGVGDENEYTWGFDQPECTGVVLARAGIGWYRNFPGQCRPAGYLGGPSLVGDSVRDILNVGSPGQAIYDLAGNLTEWTRDSCRGQEHFPRGVLKDPDFSDSKSADCETRTLEEDLLSEGPSESVDAGSADAGSADAASTTPRAHDATAAEPVPSPVNSLDAGDNGPIDETPGGTQSAPTLRVVKGGSWRGGLVEARAGARSGRPPELPNRSLGFRCARADSP